MVCFFARHGQSEANVLKIFANEPGKYGLTELGREEAEELAKRMEAEMVTRCYASPLLRAQQTAGIVCGRLGLEFETADALREFSVGNHEGSCDPAAWKEYRDVEDAWLVQGDRSARIGGGECFDDIAERFVPFLERIGRLYGDSEERILFVGHGGTFACMLPLILENVDRSYVLNHHLDHTSVVKAEYRHGAYRCLQWADAVFGEESAPVTS